jgi:hypothetical protein
MYFDVGKRKEQSSQSIWETIYTGGQINFETAGKVEAEGEA